MNTFALLKQEYTNKNVNIMSNIKFEFWKYQGHRVSITTRIGIC